MQAWLDSLYQGTQSNKNGRVEGRGLGAAFMQNFVDEDKLNREAQRTANQQTATRLGENLSDLGLTSDATTLDVEGAVITRGRERADQKRQDNLQDTLTLTTAQQAPQLEEMRATNARLIQQGNQSHQLALLQMQENAEDRKAQLEYQKSRDRKADMQYNERMEQLDRKDRRMMMQSLAAGLASLGAAFAL